MPRRILRAEDREVLNNFPGVIEEADLITYFLLTPADLEQVMLNRTDTQRIGFALLLCGLRYLGFFPAAVHTAPTEVVAYVAGQLACSPDALAEYNQRIRTRQEHQQVIMTYLKFRWMGEDEQAILFEWLSQRALENDRPAILLQQASEWLYRQRIVRPGMTTLEKLALEARQRAHELTYTWIAESLNAALEANLDALLLPDMERGITPLSWLRRPARGDRATDILEDLEKLQAVQVWAIDDWALTHLPPARVKHLVQIARRSSNQALQQKAAQQRYPLLMAFLTDIRERLTDEILDLYDSRMAQTERDARRDLEVQRLLLTESLQRSAWYVEKMGSILLNETVADGAVRSAIFEIIPPDQLEMMLTTLAEQQRLNKHHFFNTRYSYLRQFFPSMIATLTFHAYQVPDPLLEAVHILRDLNAADGGLPKVLEDVPTDFVPREWRSQVINRDGSVNRRWYDLCVMWELHHALRSGRIWVEHSRRYTNLDTYLMPEDQWQEQQSVFFELVPIPVDSHERLQQLQDQLESAFEALDQQVPDDEALRLEHDRLVLTPYQGKDAPSLLSEQIQQLMPHLQLPELLHEVDTWLNFSQHLQHAGGSPARIDQLARHQYAVLLAQARNIDFKQMVDVVDLSYRQLIWCNNWYIREETLQRATNDLVNYQYRQPLSHYWGDGRFSSSDGQRFAVAVRTQNAAPLPRYFGYGRGLTFLTWTSNQYSQYGTLVTPPTHREAAYTLDKILDNDSDLEIEVHTTDTEGYTDLIFALFDLLGMQFAPRIKDISDTRLYTIDLQKPYQHLQAIITRRLNLDIIHKNWPLMLRLAGSLKFRWTTPSLLIRKLQAFPRQHVLTQALQEYGRLIKTIFILRYFQSEAYRRRIGAQLNKGEKLHALRGHIHSANRGRIRKKYPEEHLNQANCLNLIVNAVIVWNTVYMQVAIQHLRHMGQTITEQELAQLSPVRFEHINVYGKYSFDLTGPLTEAGLRPLVLSSS
jgi:TnpA family transposase